MTEKGCEYRIVLDIGDPIDDRCSYPDAQTEYERIDGTDVPKKTCCKKSCPMKYDEK